MQVTLTVPAFISTSGAIIIGWQQLPAPSYYCIVGQFWNEEAPLVSVLVLFLLRHTGALFSQDKHLERHP